MTSMAIRSWGAPAGRFAICLRNLRRPALALMSLGLFWPGSAWADWQTFSVGDGLASNFVNAMLEDRAGNLWFGTSPGGVSRYDGASWRTYTTADGLAGNSVVAMLEDRAGNLWFGTNGGASRYDGVSWRSYTRADGLLGEFVVAMIEDRAGSLWFATNNGGVSRYDGAGWRTYTSADGLASNYVNALLEDRAGNLWFGTDGGVSRYDGVSWRTYTTADGLASNSVQAILEDSAGNLWFGTWGGGVSRHDGAGWRTYTTADGLAYNYVRTMLEDRAGNLWFGTLDNGVSRYDGVSWRTYTTADGLASNYINALLEDRAGNLWFGTGGGASRYDGASWRTFTTADGLASNYINALLEDRAGNLWFGITENGVSRYDGVSWRTYTTADGLASNSVHAILEDRAGNLWFGTDNGVSRYDGVSWWTYTTADGLASNYVLALLEDRAGNLWFGTIYGGVSRYDGVSWRTYTTADGLADNSVITMLEDRAGNLWFGTPDYGVSRYDGVSWRTYTTADGLASDQVQAILEDPAGNLWFGTPNGVSRFDGVSWRTYTTADGLADNHVLAILEDHAGNLWFGTLNGGVSRYDGVSWRTYTTADGLASNYVLALLEDRAGDLWFVTYGGGANAHTPDRVAPRAILLAPPRISATRTITFAFVAAFGEGGVEFSYELDGESSTWSATNAVTVEDLSDGMHRLRVRARDRSHNVDRYPPEISFEVDATPPAPVISSPAFGQPVRGSVEIRGFTADARFKNYQVQVRPSGAGAWDSLTARVPTPVGGGPLVTWDTTTLPDGDYELRLSVADTLGLVGTALVTVIVDNHAPFADVTSPARITATTGGDIYTTNSEMHLYFPPHAFREDAIVNIAAVPPDSVPATLPSGATRALPGYQIAWNAEALDKPARLEFSTAALDPGAVARSLALYTSADGASWRRLGGTVDPGTKTIGLAVSEPGRYALYAETSVPGGDPTLSELSFTPRVFSPTGGFADREVGIGFTLGQPGSVTVRVYNRAGWLVREVASGMTVGPGANLVRWDGRDRAGAVVTDGLYLVTVGALGRTQTKTLAVVR